MAYATLTRNGQGDQKFRRFVLSSVARLHPPSDLPGKTYSVIAAAGAAAAAFAAFGAFTAFCVALTTTGLATAALITVFFATALRVAFGVTLVAGSSLSDSSVSAWLSCSARFARARMFFCATFDSVIVLSC